MRGEVSFRAAPGALSTRLTLHEDEKLVNRRIIELPGFSEGSFFGILNTIDEGTLIKISFYFYRSLHKLLREPSLLWDPREHRCVPR